MCTCTYKTTLRLGGEGHARFPLVSTGAHQWKMCRCSSGAARCTRSLGQPHARLGGDWEGLASYCARACQSLPPCTVRLRFSQSATSARVRALRSVACAVPFAHLNVLRWLQAADWLDCDYEEDQVTAGLHDAPFTGEFVYSKKQFILPIVICY